MNPHIKHCLVQKEVSLIKVESVPDILLPLYSSWYMTINGGGVHVLLGETTQTSLIFSILNIRKSAHLLSFIISRTLSDQDRT